MFFCSFYIKMQAVNKNALRIFDHLAIKIIFIRISRLSKWPRPHTLKLISHLSQILARYNLKQKKSNNKSETNSYIYPSSVLIRLKPSSGTLICVYLIEPSGSHPTSSFLNLTDIRSHYHNLSNHLTQVHTKWSSIKLIMTKLCLRSLDQLQTSN